MQKIINKIEEKIISFLREEEGSQNIPLSELCKDSCSEMSRLTSFWLSQIAPKANFQILKGDEVHGEKSHDILAINYSDKVFLIDTTIWQFFPDRESIYLGEFTDLNESISFLKQLYGGTWQISEKLTEKSFSEKDAWENIIRLNLKS